MTSALRSDRRTKPKDSIFAALVAISIAFLLTGLTLPRGMGDTHIYASEIRAYLEGAPDSSVVMWDFGHLAWRWMGLGLFEALRPMWIAFADGDKYFAINWSLIAISWAGTWIGVYFLFLLVARFTPNRWIQTGSCVAYAVHYGVLDYMGSGISYLAGGAFLIMAMFFMIKAANEGGPGIAIASGLAMAMSVLIWFPFILLTPAWILAPYLLLDSQRDSWPKLGWAVAALSVVLAAGFLIAIIALHLTSLGSILAWAGSSGHGWDQNRRLQRWVFGFPRSFFYAGNDGLLFKRYLFHDPYAPVKLFTLLSGPIFKVVFFFAYIGAFVVALLQMKRPKLLLWWFLGFGAINFFAIFIFEPGSIERYIPMLPVLVLAGAIACQRLAWFRYASAVFVLAMAVNNIHGLWRPSVRAEYDATANRLTGAQRIDNPASIILVLNLMDELTDLTSAVVYHPANRSHPPNIRNAIQTGTKAAAIWRELNASYVMQAWNAGGDLWVSDRMLADRPKPEWRWTEGDDAFANWKDVSSFYKQFEYTGAHSGNSEDGFEQMKDCEANRRILEPLAAKYYATQQHSSSPVETSPSK